MLDLFSGIGGFSLAADWTGGIETVAFCEIEPFCQKILKKHWPDVPIFSDIKELRGEDVGRIDIVCGGFPCQPFSQAGKQRGKEDDRYLWPEMFRIIQETKPAWVVGENVPGIIELGLEQCFLDLESEGYEVQPLIIPACAINAPHQRYRVWIVAYTEITGTRENYGGIWERLEGIGRGQRSDKENVAYTECDATGSAYRKDCGNSRRVREIKDIKQWNKMGSNITDSGLSSGRIWDIEPDVGRVANGVSDRTHRLKALGNSIVPQVVYPILQGIVDIERGKL